MENIYKKIFFVDINKVNSNLKRGLSGVLRVKNEAETLGMCIESCIHYLDELIIVFQQSQDNTEEIINEYYKKYQSKIKIFKYLPSYYLIQYMNTIQMIK